MHRPAQITPERMEAMLSAVAEVGLAAVEEAGARLAQAGDAEAFERASRALTSLSRNLRQTLALKLRHDREHLTLAPDRRAEAATQAREARAARRAAVVRRRSAVTAHFERTLWNEYEPREAEAALHALDLGLGEVDDEDAFLAAPLETLIAQYQAICAAGAADPDRYLDDDGDDDCDVDLDGDADDDAPAPPQAPARPPPPPRLPRETGEVAAKRTEGALAVLAPPPEPPPQPPDPPVTWPEPYVPPWDRLRPGEIIPGGSGW